MPSRVSELAQVPIRRTFCPESPYREGDFEVRALIIGDLRFERSRNSMAVYRFDERIDRVDLSATADGAFSSAAHAYYAEWLDATLFAKKQPVNHILATQLQKCVRKWQEQLGRSQSEMSQHCAPNGVLDKKPWLSKKMMPCTCKPPENAPQGEYHVKCKLRVSYRDAEAILDGFNEVKPASIVLEGFEDIKAMLALGQIVTNAQKDSERVDDSHLALEPTNARINQRKVSACPMIYREVDADAIAGIITRILANGDGQKQFLPASKKQEEELEKARVCLAEALRAPGFREQCEALYRAGEAVSEPFRIRSKMR